MAANEKYLKIVDEYAKDLEALAGQEVVVGIPASKNGSHVGDSLTLVEIGAIHEFGAPNANIPQRSFLRVPLQANAGKIFKTIEKDLKIKNMNPKQALGRLGAAGQAVVLESFKTQNDGAWQDLKSSTKNQRKKGKGTGDDKPLVDTGQLRRSITFEVRKNVT